MLEAIRQMGLDPYQYHYLVSKLLQGKDVFIERINLDPVKYGRLAVVKNAQIRGMTVCDPIEYELLKRYRFDCHVADVVTELCFDAFEHIDNDSVADY